MAAFSRSPTGPKAMTVVPMAMVDVACAIMPGMPALRSKIGTAFAEILQKHGYVPK